MSATVDVPEGVRRKAVAVGAEGERWLRDLGRLLAEIEAAWGLEVGSAMGGGSGGFVANASTADGAHAVLKLAIPDGLEGHCPFDRELQTLRLGDGQGYVRVMRADSDRRAMLQERLGRPLSSLELPVDEQIDIIAATLRVAWRPLPAGTTPPLPTGAEQAHGLVEFIETRWHELGQPCPRRTVDCALAFARSRRDAFDPATAVMVHGDADPANTLEATSEAKTSEFKLIDPDGMLSEPAHDLAIPLRDWTDELLAGDPVAQGLAWCHRLGERSGTAPGPIWEWAFVERVSSGLFLLQLGDPSGARFLEVAELWIGAYP